MSQSCRNNWSVLLTSQLAPWRRSHWTITFTVQKRAILHRIVGLRRSTIKGVRSEELTMTSISHRFLVRVRSLSAFLAASLRKYLGMEAHDGDFASQRVCPFCGLITPRYETCCLECGKALKPA